jgi:hypothetical protein
MMGRPNVGVTEKDQQLDAIRDAESIDQPEDNCVVVAQGKASPQRVAQAPLVQNHSRTATHARNVSYDQYGSAEEKEGDSVSFEKESSSQMRGIENAHQTVREFVDCSKALLPDKAEEADNVSSEITGLMPSNSFAKDCTSISHLSALHSGITNDDMPDSAEAQESQTKSTKMDSLTEQDAAKIWPRCQQSCLVCGTFHVAIPRSQFSESCARISIVLRGTALAVAHQRQHQSFIVPTDKYEVRVLGWLIWSTFVHQVALENARLGVPRKKMRKDYYVYSEIDRVKSKSDIASSTPKTVLRTQHRTKASFECWWAGNRNLKRCGGQRWLTVTFPWDMGDVNISDACFGATGPLFTLPTLKPAQVTTSKGPRKRKSKRAKSSLTEHSESLGSTGEPGDKKTSHGSDIIGAGEKEADRTAAEVEEGNGGIGKLNDGFSEEFRRPTSRDNHAFRTVWRTSREPTSASRDS